MTGDEGHGRRVNLPPDTRAHIAQHDRLVFRRLAGVHDGHDLAGQRLERIARRAPTARVERERAQSGACDLTRYAGGDLARIALGNHDGDQMGARAYERRQRGRPGDPYREPGAGSQRP